MAICWYRLVSSEDGAIAIGAVFPSDLKSDEKQLSLSEKTVDDVVDELISNSCDSSDESETGNDIRGYIELINEDLSFKNCGNEGNLTNFLKNKMDFIGAELLVEEWEPVPGMSNCGCGDLVFRLPGDIDLVVEVKRIDPILTTGSNKTRKVRRTKQRGNVVEQALKYLKEWCDKTTVQTVAAATFTEEEGLKLIVIRSVPLR